MDELFEALTLIQTGKVRHFPVVLVGPRLLGGAARLDPRHAARGRADRRADLTCCMLTDDPDEAVELIRTHSVVGSSKDGIESDRGAPET